MPIRHHCPPPNTQKLILDMPLSYGDITDHISGASLYNNGKYAWDSSLNAYVFSQNGSYGDSNVAWINNVNLYPITMTNPWIKREFDYYGVRKPDDNMFMLSSSQKNQRANWPVFMTDIYPSVLPLGNWYHIEQELKIKNGSVVLNVTYVNGTKTSVIVGFNVDNRQNQSATRLYFTCGFYSGHSNYSYAMKNLKYWDLGSV